MGALHAHGCPQTQVPFVRGSTVSGAAPRPDSEVVSSYTEASSYSSAACLPGWACGSHSPPEEMWKGPTGFSTSEAFNKTKVQQDWTSHNYQHPGLDVPHLKEFQHHQCPSQRFSIDAFGDHLHCCTQHASATQDAHEHIIALAK